MPQGENTNPHSHKTNLQETPTIINHGLNTVDRKERYAVDDCYMSHL